MAEKKFKTDRELYLWLLNEKKLQLKKRSNSTDPEVIAECNRRLEDIQEDLQERSPGRLSEQLRRLSEYKEENNINNQYLQL